MEQDTLCRIAEARHGQLGLDVVHDLYCKFGEQLPSTPYLITCINHAKPDPIQQMFEMFEPDESTEQDDSEIHSILARAVTNVQALYPEEVDTFLNCKVNGDIKSFSTRYDISKSVLEKICKFARYEILREFKRISIESGDSR